MSSGIPNILKLAPVTAVKTDNQAESRSFSTEGMSDRLTASSNVLQVPTVNLKEVKPDESQKVDPNSSDIVKKAVDEGNSLLQVVNRNLQFKVDETTKELVVKVVDSESGELVRQIPSEEVLAFIQRMQELEGQQGLMIQDRA
ncbi:flagellar protein FlaG [Methylomonas rapida]|uniref:Flagellar protein FlaG n=1 Tax=Methylomonas rapida TaxID=2963939 RepID=A0ABY7GLM8_9GAMM|nr:flagellar protein FlaG [Methylomonas rapida]WAR45413.1 flagellar protein FlaG [Methylomonas rapida]